jgi:5-methylthioadenosine/S-adenosylhomocysteine deaminase
MNTKTTSTKAKNITRKGFLAGAGGALAGMLIPIQPVTAKNGKANIPAGNTFLIKGGTVINMANENADADKADILVEGGFIREIASYIESDAEIIEADGQIVMPGFVDTHRHMWQGALRNILPDGLLSDYMQVIGGARSVFRPEDVHTGNLLSALGAIDAGITTILDWSHISSTPEHSDAAIEALRDSGIRAVYAMGNGADNPLNRFPEDLRRVRRELVPSDEGLITLAIGAGINRSQWQLARDAGARISVHVNGTGDLLPLADVMGPDVTCIHCCNLNEMEWELLADKGTGVSIAAPVEMIMGHGIPPIQQTLDYGITASLSVDVETTVPGDMFGQMQSILTLQRMQVLNRRRQGEENLPPLLTAKEVLKMATLNGALHNGLDHKTGTLEPGKRADIIMLNPNKVNVMPLNDPAGAVVTGMDRSNVEMVMIDGSIKKWKGELVFDGLERLKEKAMASQEFIYKEAGWR